MLAAGHQGEAVAIEKVMRGGREQDLTRADEGGNPSRRMHTDTARLPDSTLSTISRA